MRVQIRFESEKLEFPAGAVPDEAGCAPILAGFACTLPPRNTTIRFPVETRASGHLPAADDRHRPRTASSPSASARYTVRSTVVSGVGIFLTIGAGLFLAIWWITHWRASRRAAHQVHDARHVTERSTGGAEHRLVRSSVGRRGGDRLSRITGFLRVTALATIGFGRLTDVYNIANSTPNIVYELLLGGILTATLVPLYVEHLHQHDERASDAINTVSLVALLAISVVGFLAAPWIIELYTLRLSGPGRPRSSRSSPRRCCGSSCPRSSSTASLHSRPRCSTPAAASPRRPSRRCSTTSS